MSHRQSCRCQIFENKRISLPILAIHTLLIQIEKKLPYHDEFQALEWKFTGELINKFIFHVKIIIDPPSQIQKKLHIFMKCTFSSLLRVLKDYINHNYVITIEMCNEDEYNKLDVEYVEKDVKIVEIHPMYRKL